MRQALRYHYESTFREPSSVVVYITSGYKDIVDLRSVHDKEAERLIQRDLHPDDGIVVITRVEIVDVILPEPQLYYVDEHTGVKAKERLA